MTKQIKVQCQCGSDAPTVDELLTHLETVTGFRTPLAQQRISQADYDNHDCHLSADDGCGVCEAWAVQQAEDRRVVDEAMLKIQLGGN